MKDKEVKRKMVPVYFRQTRYERLKELADSFSQDRTCSMSSLVGEVICGLYLRQLDNGEVTRYPRELEQLEFILDNSAKDGALAVREFLTNLEEQLRADHG